MLQDASVYRIFKGRKHSFRDRYTTKSKLYSISAINSQNYITANQSLRIVPKSVTFSALRFIPTDFNYSQFLATRRESDSKTPSKEVEVCRPQGTYRPHSLLTPTALVLFRELSREKVRRQHNHHLIKQESWSLLLKAYSGLEKLVGKDYFLLDLDWTKEDFCLLLAGFEVNVTDMSLKLLGTLVSVSWKPEKYAKNAKPKLLEACYESL